MKDVDNVLNKQSQVVKTKCKICQSDKCNIIYENYPGFVENTFFDIYRCENCNSHFIICESSITELYEIIYNAESTFGYDRYYEYMQEIKAQKNPLKFLAFEEPVYYPVYKYLKSKKNLDILDIGCGYGYLTYAMRQSGFNARGIDISAKAISIARREFGDYYSNENVETFAEKNHGKFDIIVATELLEHLDNPGSFLEICKKLLKENGKIILTTPNKDYFSKGTAWITDLPPVHITWFGKRGIELLGERCKLIPEFEDYSQYYPRHENRLVRFFRTRGEVVGNASLTKEGKAIKKRNTNRSIVFKAMIFCLHKLPLVRIPSNFIHNLFIHNETTMGVILKKF